VTDAAATGGFEHEDAHLTRTRLVLDEQGWAELSQELHRVLEHAEKLQEQSKKRLEKADHEGERRTGLVTMLYESSPAVPQADAARHAGKDGAPVKKRSRARV
jgi:gamma-glutamyl phosphate reductase